jgi:adenylosuccinate synthase
MIKDTDIVVDLQAGDTGKGKVAHHLAKHNNYDVVLRYNGGANAGHTIYHEGQKIVTHQVPVGIFYNIPSIIGVGCVVNIPKLVEELDMLRSFGFTSQVYIDKRCHITTDKHIEEDGKDTKIGTTRQGIGPTYRDKYARTGTRILDYIKSPSIYAPYQIVDTYRWFFDIHTNINVLCEGAQGFQIDIDWGDYPYVTSSHCTVGSVALNGVPPSTWRKVYGIMKAYETYSGFKQHFMTDENDPVFQQIQEVGEEFGATTGRKRKVRWLDLDGVIQAMYINDVTDLIINKVDVLDKIGKYGCVHYKHGLMTFTDGQEFREYVEHCIRTFYKKPLNIIWSTTPNGI